MPITDHETVWSRHRAIHEAIRASNENVQLWFTLHEPSHWDGWYFRILSAIDVLAAGASIIYLSSSVSAEDGVGGEVVAFTETTIIHVSVSSIDERRRDGEVVATTWRRSDLESITIDQPSVFDPTPPHGSGQVRYPYLQRFKLEYRARRSVTLPVADRASREAYEGAAELSSALVDDLRAAR